MNELPINMDYNKLTKLLNEQRKIGQYCDVIIKLNSEFELSAHFCVLAGQSGFVSNKYFLQEKMQFSILNPLKIEICNFGCESCLSDVLDYIYTSKIIIKAHEHEEHIKSLSKILSLQELQNYLNKNNITPKLDNNITPHSINNCKFITDIQNKIVKKKMNYQYKIRTKPSQSKMHACKSCEFKCYKPLEMILHVNDCKKTCTVCSLCDAQFSSNVDLKNHLLLHEHEKPFFCVDCDLRFITKTALRLHTPKHSTETPHMCSHCGKGFKWKHGLNSHLIVHSNEKKLLCDECGYSTSHLKTLRAHKLSHTGNLLRCSVAGCTHTSRRKDNLKIHIATHKNETPFVCEICGHRFSQNKNLKRHALLHLSKNLHKCPHCAFSSHRTDKLSEHINRQHTEKPLLLELTEDVQNVFDTRETDIFTATMKNLDNGIPTATNILNKQKKKIKINRIKNKINKKQKKFTNELNDIKFRLLKPKPDRQTATVPSLANNEPIFKLDESIRVLPISDYELLNILENNPIII